MSERFLKIKSFRLIPVLFFYLLVISLAYLAFPATSLAQSYVFVTKWGSLGTGDGQFDKSAGVEVDSADNVYVADRNNDRIQKFTSTGTFITKWGSLGTGDGQFDKPTGVGVDLAGNVYVTDSRNNRLQKFTSSGTFLTKWGSFGSGDGQFDWPTGVEVDSSNNVYVTEGNNNRIQKFNSTGTFLTKWGSFGSGDGQFDFPTEIGADSASNVYVADRNNNRIQKFTSTGTFITKWGSLGTGDGQFDWPAGVGVDSAGNVYVAERNNNRIQKFTSSGTFITKWGSFGSGDSQFDWPTGVDVDSANNVYVADRRNNRIQKFAIQRPILSGSIIINNGAKYAGSRAITLTLTASANVTGMRFSNDAVNWSAWETYLSIKKWTLSSGDGTKTVRVQFRDSSGNESEFYSDSIILAANRPKTFAIKSSAWRATAKRAPYYKNLYLKQKAKASSTGNPRKRKIFLSLAQKYYQRYRKCLKQIADAPFFWKVEDNINIAYVKLKIKKRTYSRSRAIRKQRYWDLYKLVKAKALRINNRIMRRRYLNQAKIYKRRSRSIKPTYYRHVKTVSYG